MDSSSVITRIQIAKKLHHCWLPFPTRMPPSSLRIAGAAQFLSSTKVRRSALSSGSGQKEDVSRQTHLT